MRGIFNSSFVFWIWLISVFSLGLKINNVSGSGSGDSFEAKSENLRIPALGRISYGIGALYDGRTGNFLPPEFSAISEKTRLGLNPKVISRKKSSLWSQNKSFPLYRPSGKLDLAFQIPESGRIVRGTEMFFHEGYDGLALRAIFGVLEFPENGTGGFLLDKVTQQEFTQNSTSYKSNCVYTFQDQLILPGTETETGKNQSLQHKILRREIRRNLKRADIKILKKATHVVVKVIRGSKTVNSSTATSHRIFSDGPVVSENSTFLYAYASFLDAVKAQLNAQQGTVGTSLPPWTPEGVPLSFELMPLLQFLNESGLELTPSSQQKFKGLESSNWRDPMRIDHSATFENLDWTWLLIRQMIKLNTTLHQCLQENPNKDWKRGGQMIQELENLYENFTQKLTTYKSDLKILLEKSSSGTEQDGKLWDSLYVKDWRAVGTGMHWDFHRDLEAAQKKVFSLGGEKVTSDTKYNHYMVGGEERKIGCDAIPKIM